MADIASQLISGAQRTAETQPDLAGAVESGVGLATKIEQLQSARTQIEQQKQQLRFSKISKVVDVIKSADKFKDKAAQNALLKNFLPKMISSMGVDDVFTEDMTAMLQASPEVRGKMLTLVEQVRNQEITPAQAFAQFTPDQIGNVDEKIFLDAAETAKTEAAKERRAQLVKTAAGERFEERERLKREKETRTQARQFGQQLVKLGLPQIETTLRKINDEVIPGGIDSFTGDRIAGIGGADAALPTGRLSTKGRRNRQLALGLGNQILKLRSGAQINEQEANRILGELGIDQAIGEGGGIRLIFKGTRSSEDFVNGVRDARDRLGEVRGTLESSFGSEAVSLFERQQQSWGVQRPKSAGKPQPTTLVNPATGKPLSPQAKAKLRDRLQGAPEADVKTAIDRMVKASLGMTEKRARQILGID